MPQKFKEASEDTEMAKPNKKRNHETAQYSIDIPPSSSTLPPANKQPQLTKSDVVAKLDGGFEVTTNDMKSLQGKNWLNDNIINFYMQIIVKRNKENDKLPSVCALSTYFYPKLLKEGYSGVERWTKKLNLFSFDLILIPIHLGQHWCLVVVNFKCTF